MAGTKQRILDTARELFAAQGVQKTSMRDIADRLGITKPALYYHFSSREDLVRSIVQPLLDGGDQILTRYEAAPKVDPRELLETYFDFHYAHRDVLVLILNELTMLAELGMIERVMTWRDRLMRLLTSPEPTIEEATRAVVAIGGLQDCTIQFRHLSSDELRGPAVDAACAALGIGKTSPEENRDGAPVV